MAMTSRLGRSTRTQPQANGKGSGTKSCDTRDPSYQPTRSSKDCCGPPPLDGSFRRGIMPTVITTCQTDAVVQVGRIDEMWVPEFIVWNFFARGADYSPAAPIQATGVKAAGDLVLTQNIPVFASRKPTQGPKSLLIGNVVSIGTSANVTAGDSTIDMAGTFEDGSAYTQEVQWSQGAAGNSRWLQMFSKEVQGGAYPALVELRAEDYLVVEVGTTADVSIAAGPTQSLEFLDGLTAGPAQDLTTTVTQGNQGTNYTVQSLTPLSDYYYWGMAYWETSARGVTS